MEAFQNTAVEAKSFLRGVMDEAQEVSKDNFFPFKWDSPPPNLSSIIQPQLIALMHLEKPAWPDRPMQTPALKGSFVPSCASVHWLCQERTPLDGKNDADVTRCVPCLAFVLLSISEQPTEQ